MAKQIEKLWQLPVVLLDGATGTWLQKSGLSSSCPEKWVLEHPDSLSKLQEAYCMAGSRVLYAFTFGANRIKLGHHGISGDDVQVVNENLAAISCGVRDTWNKKHPDSPVFVAGDLAPTGAFLAPAGTLSFTDLIDIYKQQAAALLTAGVDLFVIETMFDLAQTRAAVLAVRDLCDLPVIATMTLEAHGHTLSGNTPLTCLLSLAEMGIQAFGLNCSQGPEKLGEWLAPLTGISPIPLVAKPNAGLPIQENDQTVFPMDPESFASSICLLAEQGIHFLGGCCGTTPDHMSAITKKLSGTYHEDADQPGRLPAMICSSRTEWLVDKTELAKAVPIKPASAEDLMDEVIDASEDEPDFILLDLPELPDTQAAAFQLWTAALEEAQTMTAIPFIFTCGSEQQASKLLVLLRWYHGRAGLFTKLPLRLKSTSVSVCLV